MNFIDSVLGLRLGFKKILYVVSSKSISSHLVVAILHPHLGQVKFKAGFFAHFWEHADWGKAWQSVYFVQVDCVCIFVDEEVNTAQTTAVQCLESLYGCRTDSFY